jgi:hypothetical protein
MQVLTLVRAINGPCTAPWPEVETGGINQRFTRGTPEICQRYTGVTPEAHRSCPGLARFRHQRKAGPAMGVRTLQDSWLPLDLRSVGLLSRTLSSRGGEGVPRKSWWWW